MQPQPYSNDWLVWVNNISNNLFSQVYSFGNNDYGQLGHGNKNKV